MQARKRITVIYNPVSGAGCAACIHADPRTAKLIVEQSVRPVLRLAGLDFDVVPTTHRGFATEHMRSLGGRSRIG